MQLGSLLNEIGVNAGELRYLIVDEIERSLPGIISGLQIPPPLDRNTKRVFEFKLTGRKGFRPLRNKDRQSVIRQLEHEAFSSVLRTVQQAAMTNIHSSSSRKIVKEEAVWELTNTRPLQLGKSAGIVTTTVPATVTRVAAQEISNFPKTAGGAGSNLVQLVQRLLVESPSEGTNAGTDLAREANIEDMLEIPNIPVELQEPLAQRDICGLIAVLKAGRLVAFVEPAATHLIPKGLDKIQVPTKRLFRRLIVEDLLSEYYRLAMYEDIDQSAEHSDELRFLDALLISLENEAQWSRINRRRFHLITKKHAGDLTVVEESELGKLQELADKRMHAALELPFNELAILETYASSLAISEPS